MKRAILSFTLAAACAASSFGQASDPVNVRKMFGFPGSVYSPSDLAPAASQISYHGGPIMTGANALYIIYYGAFGAGKNGAVTIINDFFSNVGGSGNYNVNTTYYDKNNNFIINSLSFSPANNTYNDNYSIGKNIGRAGIEKIVANALNGGHFPVQAAAIYFVVTAPDVQGAEISGLCAFHSNSTKLVSGANIIYSAIPDFGGSALKSCDGNIQVFHENKSPNNNLGADDALDSFMHELSESVTDPDGTAWYGPKGENGDLCNFNYGTTYLAANGAHANTHLGGRDFLVQTIFSNTANQCLNTLP